MVKTLLLLVLTLGGIWAAAVLVLSLESAGPKMPAATPVYESRAALAMMSYPLGCDATVTQLRKTRCYSRKEPHGQ